MQRLLALLLVTVLTQSAFTCTREKETPYPDCGTPATIRNLTGLDGCSYVLELQNGKRLEPRGSQWESFHKADGLRVTIGYNYITTREASHCMVGEVVTVDCIQPQPELCGTPNN